MKAGGHDGSNRHYYFQRLIAVRIPMTKRSRRDPRREAALPWIPAYVPGSLGEALELIRSFVNEDGQIDHFTREPRCWNQTCVAMDVLADTHLALHAYVEEWEPASVGLRYIAAYGSLQALFLQQDALTHLSESLGKGNPAGSSATLKEIREIRNRAIGHPTKHGRKGEFSYHLIARITMSGAGFQLFSHHPQEEYEFEWIPVSEMIREQEGLIREMLMDLYRALCEDEAVPQSG